MEMENGYVKHGSSLVLRLNSSLVLRLNSSLALRLNSSPVLRLRTVEGWDHCVYYDTTVERRL